MDADAFRNLLSSAKTSFPRGSDGSGGGGGGNDRAGAGAGAAGEKKARSKWVPRVVKKSSSSTATSGGLIYRDRAAERRAGGLDTTTAEGVDDAESLAALDYTQSKFLGGDLSHTHLVRGVDFTLLDKMRRAAETTAEADLEEKLMAALASGSGGLGGVDSSATATKNTHTNAHYVSSSSTSASISTSSWALRIVEAATEKENASLKNNRFQPGQTLYRYSIHDAWNAQYDAAPLIILNSENDLNDICTFSVIDKLSDELVILFDKLFGGGSGMATTLRKGRQLKNIQTATTTATRELVPWEPTVILPPMPIPKTVPLVVPTNPPLPLQAPPVLAAAAAAAVAEEDDDDIFSGVGNYSAVIAMEEEKLLISEKISLFPTQLEASKVLPIHDSTMSKIDNDKHRVMATTNTNTTTIAATTTIASTVSRTNLALEALTKAKANVPEYLRLSDVEINDDAEALGEWELMDGTETRTAARDREAANEKKQAIIAQALEVAAAAAARASSIVSSAPRAYARRSTTLDPLAKGGISGSNIDENDELDSAPVYDKRGGIDGTEYLDEICDDDMGDREERGEGIKQRVMIEGGGTKSSGGGVGSIALAAAQAAVSALRGQAQTHVVTASGRASTAFAGLSAPKIVGAASVASTKTTTNTNANVLSSKKPIIDNDLLALHGGGDLSTLGGDRVPTIGIGRGGVSASTTSVAAAAGASRRGRPETEWNAGRIAGRGGDGDDEEEDDAGGSGRREMSKRAKIEAETTGVLRILEEKRKARGGK